MTYEYEITAAAAAAATADAVCVHQRSFVLIYRRTSHALWLKKVPSYVL